MSRITTVKDKISKKASWPGFLASGKDSRTKVVLARKLEKQGLGSTPGFKVDIKEGLFLEKPDLSDGKLLLTKD